MQFSTRARSALVAGAIAVVAGGAAASAAIPSADGTIHSCYRPGDGKVRIVDSAANCKSNETALVWNQNGAKGDKGDPGPTGPGVNHLVVRSSEPVTVPSSGPINRQAFAFCQSGEKVVSGGADVQGIPGGTRRGEFLTFVVSSRPMPDAPTGQTPSGWVAEATNLSAQIGNAIGEDSVLRAHVICAS